MSCTCLQGMELLIHLDGYSGPQKDGWKALTELAAASSLVITEEMPTSPYAQWSKVGPILQQMLCAHLVTLACTTKFGL